MVYTFTIPPSDTPIEIRVGDHVRHMDSTQRDERGIGTVTAILDDSVEVQWPTWSTACPIDRAFLCRVES